MVPNYFSIYVSVIFCNFWNIRYDRRGTILCTLARNNIIVCNSNKTKKNIMSIGFFIIGGIIFTIYMALTILNIYISSKKTKEENYPNKK